MAKLPLYRVANQVLLAKLPLYRVRLAEPYDAEITILSLYIVRLAEPYDAEITIPAHIRR